jgi:hypothetical protein
MKMMAQKKTPAGGKDNFTRYLVIGVVVAVLAIMIIPTVISKTKPTSQAIPASVTADNNYAISFNTELTGVPVVDIWEDFQCPICQQFEGLNGQYISSLVKDKKATVRFHTLSFLEPVPMMRTSSSITTSECMQTNQLPKTPAPGPMIASSASPASLASRAILLISASRI